MNKSYYSKNNLILAYLLLFIVCLCLSACSKGAPEVVTRAYEPFDRGSATHTAGDLPTITLKELDETEPIVKESAASEYILSESDLRFYTMIELSHLSTTDLRLYFTEKSWYTPKYTPDEFEQKGYTIFNEYEVANCSLIVTMEQLADYKDILDEKQFRRLYASTERFQDNKQTDAQVIDHGSYYEVTHGCIVGDASASRRKYATI